MSHLANTYDLNGRHAVVTGGSGEIGLAIAKRLLSCGASVDIWDMAPAPSSYPLSAQATHQFVDITNPDAVMAAMKATAHDANAIDILINSAGITGPVNSIKEYDLNNWHKTLDVNLNGAFYCTKAALMHMEPQRRGHIISLASIAGKEGNPGMAAYSVAKAGIIAMTKSLGRELASTQIRVHAIAPALIKTNLLLQMKPETVAQNLAKIPLGHAGRVEDVAELAAWLVSTGCRFSTGAVHDLSGGRATY
ncbi:hypothetical protein RC74_03370 [Falsihalocynthiibacter arcticus]|uniref:3-oxoacyl-ACP reductase n=2 Tax=Falsihalocynthiibacter arcticus TaxID=1579316 RepID=A0A126UWJ7_9RHOB|nr:hypothetical protein RC74_03370 [Falsihalocynthiibacter arcticus]